MDERYATIAVIDIGTSKVSCGIAHIGGDGGSITVVGKGTAVNTGMRKGVVTDIEKTGAAIKAAVDAAERLSVQYQLFTRKKHPVAKKIWILLI